MHVCIHFCTCIKEITLSTRLLHNLLTFSLVFPRLFTLLFCQYINDNSNERENTKSIQNNLTSHNKNHNPLLVCICIDKHFIILFFKDIVKVLMAAWKEISNFFQIVIHYFFVDITKLCYYHQARKTDYSSSDR